MKGVKSLFNGKIVMTPLMINTFLFARGRREKLFVKL